MSDAHVKNAAGIGFWDDFCSALAAAGHSTVAAAAPGDGPEAADGITQLSLLLETALRWHLRGNDPDFPRFIEINDTPEVADNLFAAVRADGVYRLTGDVSTLFDLNISVHSNWGWVGPSQTSGDLGRAELEIDEHGRFTLIVGGEKPTSGNWLPLPPDAGYVQIREYHADYGLHRPGSFDIVRIGSEGQAPPARTSPDELATKLDQACVWARNYGSFHREVQARIYPAEQNAMRPPSPQKGGNSHIWYGFGRFGLQPDEALILEFEKPNARLWNVQWLQAPWYETSDILNRLTGLLGSEMDINADGRVRVVFAGRDPGVRNWLDTTGYKQGMFVTRWIWCEQGPPTQLSVVPLNQLGSHLPADTPSFSVEQRIAQIARRRAHFVHRRR